MSQPPNSVRIENQPGAAGSRFVCTDLLAPFVAVLFARRDSIYKTIPGCEVYDQDRDALTYAGGMPVVAHPPCRAWGNLSHFAKPRDGEKQLAEWAVEQVRRWGGVLEHPKNSRLWAAMKLPKAGSGRDGEGAFSISVDQHWWGHRANKETWLYIKGLTGKLPATALRIDEGTHYIMRHNKTTSRNAWRQRLPTWEREATPIAFAEWLVNVARLCGANVQDQPRAEKEQ